MKHFDPVKLYYLFIYFLYKKKSGDSTPLTQKERHPSNHLKISFLRGLISRSLTVVTPLEMSRAKLHVRLK